MNKLSTSARTTRLFLIIFVPLFLLVAGGSLSYYLAVERDKIQTMSTRTYDDVAVHTDAFRQELKQIVSDLRILSSNYQFRHIAVDSENTDLTALAHDYLTFIIGKQKYDKIRFIDDKGMEIIRVNFNSGKPMIVPRRQHITCPHQ